MSDSNDSLLSETDDELDAGFFNDHNGALLFPVPLHAWDSPTELPMASDATFPNLESLSPIPSDELPLVLALRALAAKALSPTTRLRTLEDWIESARSSALTESSIIALHTLLRSSSITPSESPRPMSKMELFVSACVQPDSMGTEVSFDDSSSK